ncbi:hypothetical protein FB451DRAFT_1559435 [Mycena latifolia]|nr:hypothetical protein FB451DRAFT_1559435 [Mycena latifolia]
MAPHSNVRLFQHKASDVPAQRRITTSFHALSCESMMQAFIHLHPRDLLSLARATKTLRALLMSKKKAHHVWVHSLQSATDILPCPPDLTEPEYACLCFSTRCYGSQCSKKVEKVDWELRVRLCPGCTKANVVLFDKARPPLFIAADRSIRMKDLMHIRPPSFKNAYLRTELEAAKARYLALEPAKRPEFVATTAAALVEGRIHARQMREREAQAECQAAAASVKLLAEREAAIRAKLFSLGWGDELARITPVELATFKLVNKPEPLTDADWSIIRQRLEKLMQHFRTCEAARQQKLLTKLATKRFREGQHKLRSA